MTKFHKEIFCAIDRWANLDMADIRRMEVEIKEELDKKIAAGEIAMVGKHSAVFSDCSLTTFCRTECHAC